MFSLLSCKMGVTLFLPEKVVEWVRCDIAYKVLSTVFDTQDVRDTQLLWFFALQYFLKSHVQIHQSHWPYLHLRVFFFYQLEANYFTILQWFLSYSPYPSLSMEFRASAVLSKVLCVPSISSSWSAYVTPNLGLQTSQPPCCPGMGSVDVT